jgi:cell division protein FtsB
MTQTEPQPEISSSPAREGRWVFWALFAMAVIGFAPCVLLPAWRDYQNARLVEQYEQAALDRMNESLDRQRRLAEALRSDPSVMARAAQRELEYIRPGEQRITVVPTEPLMDAESDESTVAPAPIAPPAPVRWLVRNLPALDYDAVFCDPSTRAIVILLCGGVLTAAFALFPPHRRGSG